MRSPLVLFCSLLVVSGAVSLAQTSGSVTGTLDVNGKSTKLTYGQALETKDWVLGKNNKFVEVNVVKVFLSDSPVDDQDDQFELGARGKNGKLHGVQVTITKEGKTLGGSVFHQAFSSGALSMSEGTAEYKAKTYSSTSVAGRTWMEKPFEFSGATFSFDVTFDIPVQREPKPTVEGASALETGPGKAVQEFLRAAQANDVTALKAILRKEIAEMLEKPEGKEAIMGLLGQSYPAGRKFNIVRVFDFGNRAWVEATAQRPSASGGKPVDVTYRIRLVLVNDTWKVQPL